MIEPDLCIAFILFFLGKTFLRHWNKLRSKVAKAIQELKNMSEEQWWNKLNLFYHIIVLPL